jgi:4-hydroxybenzoate polyprenyltransferase
MDAPGLSAAAAAPPATVARAPTLFHTVYRGGRFSALSFSLLLPLAGASTTSSEIGAAGLAGLAAVAVAFHVFAYVLNDVVDLPLDRTEPLRADSPLVRGVVRPSRALALALVQVPVALGVHLWQGGGSAAGSALLGGIALMAVYDLYGKRIPFPPLSDAIQGLGWVGLAAYGALTFPGPTGRTGALLALVFVYVLMISGVHGGLRDLANDRRRGARTTAVYLGSHELPRGALAVPRPLVAYALTLEALLFGISMAWLSREVPRYGRVTATAVIVLVVAAHAVLLALLRSALSATADRAAFIRAGILHLFASLGCVFLPFALFMDGPGAVTVLLAYLVPVLVMCWYDGVRWDAWV